MIYFLLQLNITLVVGSLNCTFRASLFTFMMIVKPMLLTREFLRYALKPSLHIIRRH